MSGNIEKLCKSSGKCDDQQQYKAILEAAMVYTPEIFNDNSTTSPVPYETVKSLVQGYHLINFYMYCMSNKTLLYSG